MIIIYYIILGVIVIASFMNKKSRILSYISRFVIFLIMVGNTENADMRAYVLEYNHGLHGNFALQDAGYSMAQHIIQTYLHLEYWGFKCIMVLLSLILIEKAIKYFNANDNFVWGAYLAYLVFIDTIQVRNFIAMAIFVFSLIYYAKGGKKNTLIFCALLTIASTFHVLFVYYFFFLVFKIDDKKIVRNSCIVFGVLLFLVSYITKNSIWGMIAGTFLGGRGSRYFSSFTKYSWIGCLLLFLLGLIPFVIDNKNTVALMSEKRGFLRIILNLNYCIMPALPLLLMNSNFYRLFRDILILNYIAYSLILEKYRLNSARRMLLLITMWVTVFLWNYCDYSLLNQRKDTIVPIWENNMFFGQNQKGNIVDYFYNGD